MRTGNLRCFISAALLALLTPARAGITPPPDDGKLRIICFGAHPDDCELRAGGVAAMWAAQGHHVLFVSVSNGDIGHWRESGEPLARRRKAEVDAAHRMLGIAGEVLDIHDGEILPTLENRRTITRLIREWKADVVMTHRPNDYHPDHRYTAILVQDAAFMASRCASKSASAKCPASSVRPTFSPTASAIPARCSRSSMRIAISRSSTAAHQSDFPRRSGSKASLKPISRARAIAATTRVGSRQRAPFERYDGPIPNPLTDRASPFSR